VEKESTHSCKIGIAGKLTARRIDKSLAVIT